MPYKDEDKEKECQRRSKKNRRDSRRNEWFKDRSCVYCGSRDKLEVDHINPKTKVTHQVWLWRKEKRELELAKCQALCKPCHLKKTFTIDFPIVPHGSQTRYGYHKCRCDECKKAHVIYLRKYRPLKMSGRGSRPKYLI